MPKIKGRPAKGPTATYKGWQVQIGAPSGDVYCPHNHPVDIINKWDYAVRFDEQTEQVTRADLIDWVKENADTYTKHVCRYGH